MVQYHSNLYRSCICQSKGQNHNLRHEITPRTVGLVLIRLFVPLEIVINLDCISHVQQTLPLEITLSLDRINQTHPASHSATPLSLALTPSPLAIILPPLLLRARESAWACFSISLISFLHPPPTWVVPCPGESHLLYLPPAIALTATMSMLIPLTLT